MNASVRGMTALFLMMVANATFAVPTTTISFDMMDLDISEQAGFDVLDIEGCHLAGEPGLPLLPCRAVNFVIPRGQSVSRVRVQVDQKERLPGNYYIYPAQQYVPGDDGTIDQEFIGPDTDVYESTNPFPFVIAQKARTINGWGWKIC